MELHKEFCAVSFLFEKTMIDLEKQKEPSEEEIQEWVNESMNMLLICTRSKIYELGRI